MTLLHWRPVRREDRDSLRAFTCTQARSRLRVGGKVRKVHDREWERQVQARLRTASAAPQPPHFMLVGTDGQGIGAAVWYEELDGPAVVEIRVGAVAMRHRRRGGGVADEMVSVTFDRVTERALEHGVDIVVAQTQIDHRNRPSQDVCRRAGLHQVAEDSDTGLQRWATTILISGADFS